MIPNPHPIHPGSSPLARGLRSRPGLAHSNDGIIPARAGFTTSGNFVLRPSRDHPRSRGVYPRTTPIISTPEGSSPLARGLRRCDPGHRGRQGIIPARAGFTPTARTRSTASADHPRSRGGYRWVFDSSFAVAGSSPLARGLLIMLSLATTIHRIIPARAGFTNARSGGASPRWDHPRSRGVYARISGVTRDGMGSSPLARGLRVGRRGRVRGRRIIPARAGFTDGAPLFMAASLGSSPLARGLPETLFGDEDVSGIIPARAGFTPISTI